MAEETNVLAALEAVLFTAGDPVTADQLAKIFALSPRDMESWLQALGKELDDAGRGLTLRHVGGGWQLATRPAYSATVEKLAQVVDRKLSAPTMETLSIIAFKQPITRQEIEYIRGGRAERALAKLVEMGLIQEVGRKAVMGRPILYGTTEAFLTCFGLNSLADLPALPALKDVASGAEIEQLSLLDEITADPQDETETDKADDTVETDNTDGTDETGEADEPGEVDATDEIAETN